MIKAPGEGSISHPNNEKSLAKKRWDQNPFRKIILGSQLNNPVLNISCYQALILVQQWHCKLETEVRNGKIFSHNKSKNAAIQKSINRFTKMDDGFLEAALVLELVIFQEADAEKYTNPSMGPIRSTSGSERKVATVEAKKALAAYNQIIDQFNFLKKIKWVDIESLHPGLTENLVELREMASKEAKALISTKITRKFLNFTHEYEATKKSRHQANQGYLILRLRELISNCLNIFDSDTAIILQALLPLIGSAAPQAESLRKEFNRLQYDRAVVDFRTDYAKLLELIPPKMMTESSSNLMKLLNK